MPPKPVLKSKVGLNMISHSKIARRLKDKNYFASIRIKLKTISSLCNIFNFDLEICTLLDSVRNKLYTIININD